MPPYRRLAFVAALLGVFSRCCDATQIVVVVAKDGIVIAADSKQRAASNAGLADNEQKRTS